MYMLKCFLRGGFFLLKTLKETHWISEKAKIFISPEAQLAPRKGKGKCCLAPWTLQQGGFAAVRWMILRVNSFICKSGSFPGTPIPFTSNCLHWFPGLEIHPRGTVSQNLKSCFPLNSFPRTKNSAPEK